MKLYFAFALLALVVCANAEEAKEKRGPKVTNKVFFDIEIGGEAAGMVILHSYVFSIDELRRDLD